VEEKRNGKSHKKSLFGYLGKGPVKAVLKERFHHAIVSTRGEEVKDEAEDDVLC